MFVYLCEVVNFILSNLITELFHRPERVMDTKKSCLSDGIIMNSKRLHFREGAKCP